MTDATPTDPSERRRRDLARIAANLRWSWHRPAAELLGQLPGATVDRHPLATISQLEADQPGELADYLDRNTEQIEAEAAELVGLEQPPPHGAVAYFCPEFGIAAQVPQYSGGLGILAGDHLKAASDLGIPMVGVGLFYHQGFFRQGIVDGRQTESYDDVDPDAVGAADTGERIYVLIEGHPVVAAVRRMWVGATQLLLLDADLPENPPAARAITNRLYAGGRRQRLSQELLLGVGGIQALRQLEIPIDVYHLNEGHACFLLLELLAEQIERGEDLDAATEAVRAVTLFTTHTPVPAGIDRFERGMAIPELEPWAQRLRVSVDVVARWGFLPSDGPDQPFNTAALALTLCGRVNGVSQLHAAVSRDLFGSMPQAARIEGITNGVHARTWVAPELQQIYDEVLGKGWEHGDADAWSAVDQLDRDRVVGHRLRHKRALVELIHDTTGYQLDPERPIISFARRFATYKRAALLLRDPKGLGALLTAGCQLVFAGKAHPADEPGKAVLSEIAEAADHWSRAARSGALVVVPDYDITVAKALYAGTDVWLNNPIRPREACGTSGEKAALNGALNCSIRDGWWADWYVDGIGWAIPTCDAKDPVVRDDTEAAALSSLLLDEVMPVVDGYGDAWWAMVTAMLAHLGPQVTAGRMVTEYDRRFYQAIRTS